jgi:hypothetical protein
MSPVAIPASVSTTDSFSRARTRGLELDDGVISEDRNLALTHDRAGVVFGINEMNRNARFRLTGLKHRLEHTIPVHPTPTESR